MAAARRIADIEKGIRNCAKIEKEKEMRYELKKTKYMMVNKRKEKEDIIEENVKSATAHKAEIYQYLRITINEEGNLEDHIKVIIRKREATIKETDAIMARKPVGKGETRFKLKLFETCLMTALTYGIGAWRIIRPGEMRKIEKIQEKALKRYFNVQFQELILVS